MPARDIFHETVKRALVKDGWTITHDPLRLVWGKKDLYVDLGAERFLGAEKGDRRIAVEIKSFVGPSEMHDLEGAVGQFVIYEEVLRQREPERTIYLAVNQGTFRDVFEEPIGKLLVTNRGVRLLVFDEHTESILQWIP